MPDSSRDERPSPETAQPFFYSPPSGERARNLVGAINSSGFERYDPGADHARQDQDLQKAFERGVAEGKAAARMDFEKASAELRGEVSEAVRAFSKDRADYFSRIEVEVVRLSLSVARKILHRESQIDPMVLTGVVHVALQKLDNDTRVRLRTHPDEARFWSDYFKQTKDIYPTVEVAGDPSLAQGHCTLETDFGTTEISLDTQLKEIEQGFFDLLERRPQGEE
jgi:flagellar assembly protein FliH